jgi:thiamine-phosphate pyrophosphorylase
MCLKPNFTLDLVSLPDWVEGEAPIINLLLAKAKGWVRFHYRKPGVSAELCLRELVQINPALRKKVVLHGSVLQDPWFKTQREKWGGVHWSAKTPRPTHFALRICEGVGIHSVAQALSLNFVPAYVWLSPIYESVSKPGYTPKWSIDQLSEVLFTLRKQLPQTKIIALGGVGIEQLSEVQRIGFDGAAVLGKLWQSKNPESYLKQLEDAILA